MKGNDKIEDLASFSKLRKNIEGAELLRDLGEIFPIFGCQNKKIDEILEKVPDLKEQIIQLSTFPDIFNKHFAQSGWIAHESMNFDLMKKVIELAELGNIEEANQELISHYCSDKIEWTIIQLQGMPVFAKRYELIRAAYQDTLNQKYYSCIPLLLMVIDGSVNDIDKNKGFFSGTTDLTAWDSIAAHSTGLSIVRDIFNSTRKKTTIEPIDLPYRNGILHGRDLGYANKIVAAKCWATLIAIKDWANAIRNGKKNQPEPERELTIEESFLELQRSLLNYEKMKKKNKEISQRIERWKPRNIEIGKDIPKSGKVSEYEDFYPEQEAIRFVTYWAMKNYGKIVEQIYHPLSRVISIGKEARRIRELLDNKRLVNYSLAKIDDKSPAISEVTLQVVYNLKDKLVTKSIILRFICNGKNGESAIIGDHDCEWKFVDNFFHILDQ